MNLQRISLRRKVFWTSAGISLLLVLAISAASFVHDAESYHRSLKQELTLVAELLGQTSTAAVTFNDDATARELLGYLRVHESIRYAEIRDRSGHVLATFGARTLANPERSAGWIPSPDELIEVTHPIVLEGKVIGELMLQADLQRLHHQLREYLTALILLGGLGGLLAVLLSGWSTAAVLRPIAEMVAVTQEIAQGDLDRRVQVLTRDEIGTLGNSFNEMVEKMQASTQEIITTRDYVDKVLTSMGDPLFVLTPRLEIRRTNPAAMRLLGWAEGELTGRDFLEVASLGLVEPSLDPRKSLLDRLEREGSINDLELFLVTREGERIPTSFNGAAMRDASGRLEGVVGVARSMREIRRLIAEAAAAQAHREKASELQRTYDELRATHAQLIHAEKLAGLGQLGAGIAHELNQPTTAIQTLAQVMLADSRSGTGDHKVEIERIIAATHRMSRIIDNIRVFSRESHFDPHPVSPETPLENALMLLSEQLRLHEIEIVRRYAPGLPKIHADEILLQQVFLNLFSNARDALDAVVGRSDKIIVLAIALEGETVVYRLEDNGPGVPPEFRARIFDPFFTTKPPGKGTGLGLSLSYGIVKEHEGEIGYHPGAEGGACFEIRLPVAGRQSLSHVPQERSR